MFRRISPSVSHWLPPVLLILFGCSQKSPELAGRWALDLERTFQTTASSNPSTLEKLEALFGGVEIEFAAGRVRMGVNGRDIEGTWSVRSAAGKRWLLEGKGGDLDLRWLDADTILLCMTDDPDRPLAGLVLARQ
ncbi:MAG: hypothetical protein V2A76_13940 [Planctomycetota bacterium]